LNGATGTIAATESGGVLTLTGTNISLAGSLASGTGTPTWVKVTKSYTDFSTAGATNTLNVTTLAAKSFVHAVQIKHSTQFSGGSISAYNFGIGVTGTPNFYGFSVLDGHAAVADGTYWNFPPGNGSNYWHAGQTVTVTATATGDTLNHATQGS